MDYEKKFKEALERAKKNYKTAQDYLCKDSKISVECLKNALTDVFPELVESEDERIRKELIEHIKANKEVDYVLFRKFSPDDVLAWLEKQGEQKPQRMISAEAKEALYDKPTWNEEDENIKEDIILNLQENYRNKYINERTCLDEIHWLKSLKKR